MSEQLLSKSIEENSWKSWQQERKRLSSGVSLPTCELPLSFTKGCNDILTDADGNTYIDWTAGTLTASTGHSNNVVAEEIKSQLDQLWNMHDFPSALRFDVLHMLDTFFPYDGYRYHFFSTGSEAVENALRAGLDFSGLRKRRVLSFAEGYHGKTRGSLMAVHAIYGNMTKPSCLSPISLPFPRCLHCPYEKNRKTCALHCAKEAVNIIEGNKDIGVFIFEPILGTAGIWVPPDGYFKLIKDACQEHDIVIIADEVTTGCGRTGTFLACEHFDIQPDIVVFAKGIASGFPAMVVAGREEIFYKQEVNTSKARMIGNGTRAFTSPDGASTTFGGNLLAMAAIKGTLTVFDREELMKRAQQLENVFLSGLQNVAKSHTNIIDVRGKGMLLAVEFSSFKNTSPVEFALQLRQMCAKNGLLIYTSKTDNGIIHITPPLTIEENNIKRGLDIWKDSISRVESQIKENVSFH